MFKNKLSNSIRAIALAGVFLCSQQTFALSSSEKADLVEKRFFSIIENRENEIKLLLDDDDLFSIEIKNYQRDEDNEQATFDIESSIKIDGETINFKVSNVVDYSDKVNKKGVLARSESKIDEKEIIESFNLSSDEKIKALREALKHIKIQIELLEDETYATMFAVLPFDYEEEGMKVSFTGIDINSKSDDLQNLQNGASKVSYNFKDVKIDVSDDYEKSFDNAFTLKPFNINYVSNEGEFEISSTPIEFYGDEYRVSIDELKGNGNFEFDENVRTFIGDSNIILQQIDITAKDLPVPIKINELNGGYSFKKAKKNLYDLHTNFKMDISPNMLDGLTQKKVSVNSLSINNEFGNIPAKVIRDSGDFIERYIELSSDSNKGEFANELSDSLSTLSDAGTKVVMNFDIDTDSGVVKFNSDIQFSDKINKNKWQDVINSSVDGDNEAFVSIVKNEFSYQAVLRIPKKILDDFAVTDMAKVMAGDGLNVEGENYVFDLIKIAKTQGML